MIDGGFSRGKYKLSIVFLVFSLLLVALNVWVVSDSKIQSFFSGDGVELSSDADAVQSDSSQIIEEDCGNLYLLTGNNLTLDSNCTVEDENVATCKSGVITAIAPGQTRVSVMEDTRCKYWTLTVDDYQSIVAPMGRKLQLETLNSCTQWSCSDTGCAEIDNTGKLTPVSVGECSVTASDADGRQYGWKISVKRTAYITIDDWPDENTIVMLDIMKKYGIKATFFLASQKDHMDIYKRIIDEGHAIGNHTKTHNLSVIYESSSNLCHNVELMEEFLNEKFGVSTKLFRFPGGYFANSPAQREGYKQLTAQGYRVFDWTCTVDDVNFTKREDIMKKFKDTLDEDVEIILMHNKKSTAGVFEEVVLYLIEKDYVCLPLDEQCPTFDFVHGWQE